MRDSDKFSEDKQIKFSRHRVVPSLSVKTSKRYPNNSGMRIGLTSTKALAMRRYWARPSRPLWFIAHASNFWTTRPATSVSR
jgi:hypothetical protein